MMFLSENKIKLIPYVLLWIVYAFLYIISMLSIINIPGWAIIVDGIIQAFLYSILGLILIIIFRFAIPDSLPNFQKIINYIAIAFLTILIWIGVGFLFDFLILGEEISKEIVPILPIRILIGAFIYIILILIYKDDKKVIYEEVIPEEEVTVNGKTESEIQKKEIIERISVKIGQKLHIIPVDEVVYLQADADYVQIVTETGNYLKEQTMKFFESNLPAKQFVRIHRSHIVNIAFISRIEYYDKQSQLIVLKNGTKLKASSTGYKNLRSVLNL